MQEECAITEVQEQCVEKINESNNAPAVCTLVKWYRHAHTPTFFSFHALSHTPAHTHVWYYTCTQLNAKKRARSLGYLQNVFVFCWRHFRKERSLPHGVGDMVCSYYAYIRGAGKCMIRTLVVFSTKHNMHLHAHNARAQHTALSLVYTRSCCRVMSQARKWYMTWCDSICFFLQTSWDNTSIVHMRARAHRVRVSTHVCIVSVS